MKKHLLDILKQATSWNDIYRKLVEINNKNSKLAGTLFEYFCKYYFLADSSLNSDYKNIWLFEDITHSIRAKLGLGKIDFGIDLVLEDQEGKISVV